MTYPVSACIRHVPMEYCAKDHTIADRYILARWSSIIDYTVVGEELSTMDPVDNTTGMFGLQVQALDATRKQCCRSESEVELHD